LALPLITLFFRTILSAIQCKPKPQETKKCGLIAPEPMETIGATTQPNTSNATEIGTSGVENTTYTIDSNNQDNNPLVTPTITENTIPELSSWIVPLLSIAAIVPLMIYRRWHRF
jgi:hypothetical protein